MQRKTRKRQSARSRSKRPAGAPRAPGDDLAQLEERAQTIIDMSSDLYWEQDADLRFTLLQGRSRETLGIDPKELIGKRRWEYDHARPVGDGGKWDRHKAMLTAREAFADFRYRCVNDRGEQRYVSTSGQPMYDRERRFIGYRGLVRDVTAEVLLERGLAVEQETARLLAEAEDIAEASRRILRVFCETLDWTCGARWELDEQIGALRCVDTWGDGAPEVEQFLGVTRRAPALTPQKRGLVRRACMLGEAVWMTDVPRQGSLLRAPSARRAGLLTGFAFPIKAGAKVLGALEFYSREPQRDGDELRRVAAYIGSSLGHYLERKRAEAQLLRFRAAMDMSGDAVYLVDRTTMRFVDFNEAACRATGYAREELMALGPHRLQQIDRKALERLYDRVIAAGDEGIRSEGTRFDRHRNAAAVEQQRRALHAGGGWIIVTVSRDISERKRAEETALRLGRMYAALSGTSEAILRAASAEQLYPAVCEAAVGGGKFISTALFVPDADGRLRAAAVCGSFEPELRDARLSPDPAAPEGKGLVATAFRTGTPCISNDFPHDPRVRGWHQRAGRAGIASGIAVPLIRDGAAREVMAFYAGEPDAFDAEIVRLLERMAQNAAHALDGFERDAERRNADRLQLLEHAVTRCLADADGVEQALALTLGAIGESQGWEHGQYWRVDAQAGVLRADTEWARPGERTPIADFLARNRDIAFPRGVGLLGHAWQSGKPLWIADVTREPRVLRTDMVRRMGPTSALIFPVYAKDRILGVINFSNREIRQPDERILEAVQVIGAQIGQFLQRKQAEEVLRESETRFRALTELSSDWYWEQDAEFRFVRFEGSVPAEDKATFDPLIGRRPWEASLEIEMGADAFRALHEAHEPFKDAVVSRAHESERRYFAVSGEPIFGPDGAFRGYRGVTRDITQNRLAEERIQYLATHDALTGLPNRLMFSRLLDQAMRCARRYDRTFALLFIDLDAFKAVNDSLGHAAGDRLLGEMASRLRECLRSSDVVARFGGDEFVVLLQEADARGQVAKVARKLIAAIMQPAVLSGREFRITSSIGIALYPRDGEDEQTLTKNADMAMYLAKEEGKNHYRFCPARA